MAALFLCTVLYSIFMLFFDPFLYYLYSNTDTYRVREEKLNPILKNTIFEMLSKDSDKRL